MTKYVLPPPHEEAFAAAVEAYRAAIQYAIRAQMHWEPRDAELRKADEFSRLWCAYENEKYIAEKMCEWGSDLVKSSLRRSRAFPEKVYADFDLYTKKAAKEVLEKLRHASKLVDDTKVPLPESI